MSVKAILDGYTVGQVRDRTVIFDSKGEVWHEFRGTPSITNEAAQEVAQAFIAGYVSARAEAYADIDRIVGDLPILARCGDSAGVAVSRARAKILDAIEARAKEVGNVHF